MRYCFSSTGPYSGRSSRAGYEGKTRRKHKRAGDAGIKTGAVDNGSWRAHTCVSRAALEVENRLWEVVLLFVQCCQVDLDRALMEHSLAVVTVRLRRAVLVDTLSLAVVPDGARDGDGPAAGITIT